MYYTRYPKIGKYHENPEVWNRFEEPILGCISERSEATSSLHLWSTTHMFTSSQDVLHPIDHGLLQQHPLQSVYQDPISPSSEVITSYHKLSQVLLEEASIVTCIQKSGGYAMELCNCSCLFIARRICSDDFSDGFLGARVW